MTKGAREAKSATGSRDRDTGRAMASIEQPIFAFQRRANHSLAAAMVFSGLEIQAVGLVLIRHGTHHIGIP